MISLSKSGYSKFIRGELTPSDLSVAPIASGLINANMDNTNILTKRTEASSATPTFPIDDFAAVFYNSDNSIRINGQVNINTQNFSDLGDTNIFQHGVVLDDSDSNDFLGTILLYPDSDPITYSALNSAPVNIDYRVTGIAKTNLKSGYQSAYYARTSSGNYSSFDDRFVAGFLNLPFFDSGKTVNLLTDLRVALLSTSLVNNTFASDIYEKAKTLASLKELADSIGYTFISGGFEYNELGISSSYPCLTALDTTIYIPGLTINVARCFCVIYYETSDITNPDVNSANYQANSFLLGTISQDSSNRLYPFKQSLILDTLTPGTPSNPQYAPAGIMSFSNYVGPGLLGSKLD